MVEFRRKKPEPAGRRQPRVASPSAQRSVFSYHSKRAPARNQQLDDGRKPDATAGESAVRNRERAWRRQWIRNLPTIIAIAVVVGCLLYSTGLTTTPSIDFAGGNDTLALRSPEEYQAGARDILNGSPLNRTKFTINTGKFEQEFRRKFPEVADAAITLPLISRRPVVNITTARPQLILVSGNQTLVIDRRGTAIMAAPDLAEDARKTLPVVQDQSSLPAQLGQPVLSTDDVAFITEVAHQFKAKNLGVESMILPARAHQLDVRLVGLPYTIKFSTDTDPREAVGSFLATKTQLDREGVTPAEYIDVRVDGRAYYK